MTLSSRYRVRTGGANVAAIRRDFRPRERANRRGAPAGCSVSRPREFFRYLRLGSRRTRRRRRRRRRRSCFARNQNRSGKYYRRAAWRPRTFSAGIAARGGEEIARTMSSSCHRRRHNASNTILSDRMNSSN